LVFWGVSKNFADVSKNFKHIRALKEPFNYNRGKFRGDRLRNGCAKVNPPRAVGQKRADFSVFGL
jgi:hypothetical protein